MGKVPTFTYLTTVKMWTVLIILLGTITGGGIAIVAMIPNKQIVPLILCTYIALWGLSYLAIMVKNIDKKFLKLRE